MSDRTLYKWFIALFIFAIYSVFFGEVKAQEVEQPQEKPQVTISAVGIASVKSASSFIERSSHKLGQRKAVHYELSKGTTLFALNDKSAKSIVVGAHFKF